MQVNHEQKRYILSLTTGPQAIDAIEIGTRPCRGRCLIHVSVSVFRALQ